MESLENFGGSKMVSVLNDPFKKKNVTKIHVFYQDYWSTGKWEATGYVTLKNGNTTGEQTFRGDTFDEVVMKIKTFIEQELEQ